MKNMIPILTAVWVGIDFSAQTIFDNVDLDTVEAIFNSIDPKHPKNYEQYCNKYTECEVEL